MLAMTAWMPRASITLAHMSLFSSQSTDMHLKTRVAARQQSMSSMWFSIIETFAWKKKLKSQYKHTTTKSPSQDNNPSKKNFASVQKDQ
jgi:hypothetical protein